MLRTRHMREILTPREASEGLDRIATEMLARRGGADDLALVGIRRGGVPIVEYLARKIEERTGTRIPTGSVDITLYRDDAPVPLPMPHIGRTELPFDVATRRIVLVDDVLFTGRTVRAAMHALLGHGRAKAIELAALLDRGGRELPIQPDYVVNRVECPPMARIDVTLDDQGFHGYLVERK